MDPVSFPVFSIIFLMTGGGAYGQGGTAMKIVLGLLENNGICQDPVISRGVLQRSGLAEV